MNSSPSPRGPPHIEGGPPFAMPSCRFGLAVATVCLYESQLSGTVSKITIASPAVIPSFALKANTGIVRYSL